MFVLVRRLVTMRLRTRDAIVASIALLYPTLVLDALTSAFFPAIFPNFPDGAAGVFGGWMLISCAGGLAPLLTSK